MSSTPEPRVERLMAEQDQLVHRMGVTITAASAERVTGSMPVQGNTQPYGLLHGGASAVLIETLGSIGAVLHAGTDGMAVGVDLNATHLRGVREGCVHGEATALHLGRSVASYDVRITDDEGELVCTGRLTCAIRMTRRPAGETTAG